MSIEKRNFGLTLAGIGVSGVGSILYSFAISFYILSVTGSSTSFALSLILSTLPRVVLNPIAGNIVDRVDRKVIVVVSDFLSGILMLGLVGLTMGSELTLVMIYAANFLLSTFNVFFNNAFSASFASIVTNKKITKLNSYQQVITSVTEIGAPIVGGIVYALIDIRLFILINGISFILSGLTEMLINFKFNSTREERVNKNSFIENMVEGIRYIRKRKIFLYLSIYALVINFFMSAFSVIMPYTLVTIHEFEPQLVGYIEAAFPVGVLITSIIVGSKNIVFSKKLFSSVMFIFPVVFVAFSIPSLPGVDLGQITPIYYGLVFMLMAGSAMMINIPLGVKFQTTVEEEYRGRFFGILGMLSGGVIPLSYLICGFLIGILPTYVILYVASVALIGASLHIRFNPVLDEEDSNEKVIESVQTTS